MKPNKIFLVRHGESEGNINRELYKTVPDWKLNLTDKGRLQAKESAQIIYDKIAVYNEYRKSYTVEFPIIYSSPWIRTRQTSEEFLKIFNRSEYKEDPRLREQEWGNFMNHDPEAHKRMEEERDSFNTFYYRMPNGESGADVYDRISSFLDTLWRDFNNEYNTNDVIIISHGLTIRIFLMRWFHWSPEYFDSLCNIENCGIVELNYDSQRHRYKLVTELKKRNT